MKKLLYLTLAASMAASIITSGIDMRANADEITAQIGKAAYVCDCDSGTVVYSRNETERLPIASMCKIMTLLLSFEAVETGNLSYDEMITVSERASGMGGSQVYLQTGLSYSAEELMKTVAVCSANDSCVALAERIAGNEQNFVNKMNARAKELGADNTLFANCTGLPKEPQYSCAKDVAQMLRAMLKHEKYYSFAKIWYEDFAHPDGRTTRITNTNKLIRSYNGCDGGKTGFTNEAGFCLAATAKRGETRLVSVVIGAESSAVRNRYVGELLDNGFNCYETTTLLNAGEHITEKLPISGSTKDFIEVAPTAPVKLFKKRGEEQSYELRCELVPLKAPVQKGEPVGRITLYIDNVETISVTLASCEDAPALTWWDALIRTARKWQ